MDNISLVWKNITQQWGATLLSILLTAFGVAILTVIYISSDTFEKQLENNSKNIDLVVGAKGSPLQLILSTLYHVDNPTGNISLEEANKIAANPYIQMAVPISLGDNFKGHRIIGTDTSYLSLYELELEQGRLWDKSFEIVIGNEVARKQGLTVGDHIHSAHGLSADAHIHDDHPFTVVGILNRSNSIVDNLILCNLESVWDVHGIAHAHANEQHTDSDGHHHEKSPLHDAEHHHDDHEHAENEHAHADHDHGGEGELVERIDGGLGANRGVEITALLIKYSSPAAIALLPRLINDSTHMQAASPAIESSRIFSLLGIGLDSLAVLAYIIMVIAGLSVFISLYNALKDRKYDMAIMRTMGATKIKLFTLVIVEGIVITALGGIIGLLFGHSMLYFISTQTSESADFIEAFKVYPQEIWILIGAIILGILAATIPASKAYRTTISKILASQ
ncbi:FtsX-like permease family protein [Sphingobacterium sp. SGG-5]|uniref:ABC transporter permease n=1 Tax=Sphingobacterium sp. SGG-5 TaxID=2710881 RepID=UPI0013ED0CA0|nr:FtsX-like permease family protein [Sphingobacterium sp. SGG-5]NGM62952.1 FtsX-like permease family protein [Sphingobacterium sp. SGG-5]